MPGFLKSGAYIFLLQNTTLLNCKSKTYNRYVAGVQFHSISVIALTIAQTYYSVRLNIYAGGYLYLIALIFVFGILLFPLMQGSDWKMVVITTQSYPVSHVKAIKNMQKNEEAEPRTNSISQKP